jgi:molybdopterin converting factor small subunit
VGGKGNADTISRDSTPVVSLREAVMSVIVRVPTTLRTLTAGEPEVAVDGGTVAEVIANLESGHPGFRERILDEEGELRRFVNVFVSDDDVRFLEGLATPVPDGETLSIVPAVAGG